MQQIKLSEFTESYAVSIDHALPENEAVFFKTKDGRTFEGEFFKANAYFHEDNFDSLDGEEFLPEECISWHPVTVDL